MEKKENEKYYLTGNISNEIKEKQVNNNLRVDFDIASNPEKGETKYTKVQAWGKLALEVIGQRAIDPKADKNNLKGSKITVRGNDVTYMANDKERTVMKIDTFQFHDLKKEEELKITGIHTDVKKNQPYKINAETEKGDGKIILFHNQNKHLIETETIKTGDKLIVDGDQKNGGYYISGGELKQHKRMPEINPSKIVLERGKNKTVLYDKSEDKKADKDVKKGLESKNETAKETPKIPKAKGMSV